MLFRSFDFSNIQLSNIKHLNFQWKWVDNARDGTHPGPTTNKHMADTIFEQSWPYIKDKLNLSNIS